MEQNGFHMQKGPLILTNKTFKKITLKSLVDKQNWKVHATPAFSHISYLQGY